MENLSQQNTLLLNKRSEQENFERKRSHSPEYSSSPGSFVPHYNKKCKSHSISATSTPVQDEQSSLPTVEAPQVVLGSNFETPKTVLSSFIEGDYTYNLLSEDHKKEGSRIWINGKLKDVIMHPSGKAFRVIKSVEQKDSPYMTPIQAHDALVSFFHASEVSSDKLGPENRSFRLHFDDTSGLAHALRIIKEDTSKALHTLFMGDNQKLYKSISVSAFSPVSMVHFATGWNLTSGSTFMKFAKNEVIDLGSVSNLLRLPYTPSVPSKFLNDEKYARIKFLDGISGISMLDQTIKEVENENEVTANTLKAVARHFLSGLKDTALNWITAKFIVRQIVLQFSTSSSAIDLLRSDIFEVSLFDPAAVTEIKKHNPQNLTLKDLLDLHQSANDKYVKNPKLADPCNQTKDRSKSPTRRTIRPTHETGNFKKPR